MEHVKHTLFLRFGIVPVGRRVIIEHPLFVTCCNILRSLGQLYLLVFAKLTLSGTQMNRSLNSRRKLIWMEEQLYVPTQQCGKGRTSMLVSRLCWKQ